MPIVVTHWLHGLHDHLALMFLAMLLAIALGGPRKLREFLGLKRVRHLYQRFFRTLEMKLNRDRRSRRARAIRGLMVLIIALSFALLLPWLVHKITTQVPKGFLIEVAVVAMFLHIRGMWDDIRQLRRHLLAKEHEKARHLLRPYSWRDTGQLDAPSVARVSIEALAVHFTTRVMSPVFWYVLGGLTGLVICRQITMLARLFAHPSTRFEAFGFFMARGDRFLHAVPAQLTALLFALASLFTPRCRPLKALRMAFGKPHRLFMTYHGAPIAAAAGALNLALAGPYSRHGIFVGDPWLGIGTARATPADLKRGLWLYAIATGLLILALAVA